VVTLPSHANILTGLYPYQHGVRDNIGFKLPASVPTLATALRAAGWATGAFVGAFPLDSQFGLDRGFDVYDDLYPKGARPEEYAMPERRGDRVVAAAMAWWTKQTGRPRFLWLHLYDAHAPYRPPEPFAARYRAAPYFGEVAAVDSFLAPLLDALAAPGARQAVVAVTADHGEALGDHGELTHGLFAYEATLRVPLVLWGAGVTPGRDHRAARHVDLFPTLLEAAGVAAPTPPHGERPGRSLLAPAQPAESYFEALSTMFNRGWAPLRGVLASGRKAIALPLPELYDLAADPGESRNLAGEDRPSARALFSRLPVESQWPPPRGAGRGEADAAMRSLGYLAGEAAPKVTYGAEDDPKKLVELDSKLHRVIEAYERRDLAASVKLAREVVAARPSMPMGHALLAQALLESGSRGEALEAMLAAQRAHVATDGLTVQLGLTLSESGRAAEAIDLLRPLSAKREPRFSNALGVALSDAGRQPEAESALREALDLDPEFAKAWENLSLVALRRGRFEEARERAARAVALNPDLHLAWNNLGVALFQLGRGAEALDAWSKAVRIEPRLWDAQWNLGVQGAALGRATLAREALRRFVAGAPAARYARDLERARKLLEELGG
jgi:arylsulfatase A-like enzyme/Flp pilus assembly protein TadD